MKFNKILMGLAATLCVASAQASVIAFAVNANDWQSTDLYWDMLSASTSTLPLGALGGFKLSGHGDFDYNPDVADFVNTGAGTTGANLDAGTLINSASNWGNNSGSIGTTALGGGCPLRTECIYGLSFVMAGNTHYGWVQFHELNANRQKLTGWGYESVAGVGIGAGVKVSAAPSATPSAPVPEPVSVALLGIGLAGLALSRRQRASKPA